MLSIYFPSQNLTSYHASKLPIDEDDISLIFEDVHRGRSVIPPHNVPSRPVLVRWDIVKPLTVDNCVVMDFAEAEKHYKESGSLEEPIKRPRDIWGNEVTHVVDRRAEELRRDREWVM